MSQGNDVISFQQRGICTCPIAILVPKFKCACLSLLSAPMLICIIEVLVSYDCLVQVLHMAGDPVVA